MLILSPKISNNLSKLISIRYNHNNLIKLIKVKYKINNHNLKHKNLKIKQNKK